MMHHNQDAILVFVNIPLYIQRTTYKFEMITKQNEQMHAP